MNTVNNIAGKRVLINIGGTYEAIDPIRGISNKSSGKMGLELAKEAYIRGADLTILEASCEVNIPSIFNVIKVSSSSEMNDTVKNIISNFDIFIATAAVSDFEPIEMKPKKISSSLNISLEFKPIEKIIQQIKDINPNVFLVGFKAQYAVTDDELIDCAKKQMKIAGTDLVVANDLSHSGCGFGSDESEIILISDDIQKIPLSSKTELSSIIFDKISDSI